MKKWQELSKKAKVGLIGGAAVLVIGGTAGAVKVNADNQYRNQKNEIIKKLAAASEKGNLAQKVSQLVDKDGFLKKDLTSDEVTKLQAEISSLNDEVKQFVSIRNETVNLSDIGTLKEELAVAEKKLAIEEQLKAELTTYDGWLKADTDVKKFVISDAASVESLEGVKKALGAANLTEDSWTKKIEDVLQTAEKQLSDIATAEKLVNNLYKDKKVNPAVKRADYEKAVKAVKALTRKTNKDSLNKKLDAVKKVIEEREEAEKAKKEAEAKKKAEAEAAAKEKAEATKDVASANDTETANQPASDQKTDSDWSDSNAGSDWSGSSNTGNNSNWGSGSSSNQGATTGGNQSAGNASGGSSNSGGNNNSSGGSSSNNSGSTGGNSGSTGGNTGGGSTSGGNSGGSTGGNSGSDGGTTDADMEADGWIKPKYPIDSNEFWDWLDSMGYWGYFKSGEWIKPY
ncbi:hypothetical protein [Candidatus Enterococcus leclercqii]|uniref:hypothetical protein n=1 Tax=Candidatus Enterococcus leclercqii TaxID=1857218 RepID=UPI001379BD69|nr:hypothetical protein [Enterococcus sp. CU9D]KAF1294162.1 hypothetical protein BAU14_07175 [Enterococcus sp. CU9D]